ncbi:MAG TPA: aminoglycoside phosphotransferase family protein [Polyangiaceae bacterium]|nr:aminoglycoside phosphotransferase family protein [Polyangiaceae bacterium]
MNLVRNPSDAPLTSEDRAAIARRALEAATRLAGRHGVKSSEPAVLAERYALRVHLRPAPVVARVSTFTSLLREPIDAWLGRELDVSAFLHGRGAPVVPPSDLLPPGPHREDGFAISLWSYVEPVSNELPGPEVAGRMLAELHESLREYPGDLPHLAPPLNDIPRGLDRLEQMPAVLPASELAMLRRVADRLLPALREAVSPAQTLHGDAHVYNMISTSRGLLWNDFEDTCRGPIEWDLSSLIDPDGKALAAYAGAPSIETVEAFRKARILHGTVWVLALLPEIDELAVQARAMLDMLRPLA